MRGPAATPCTPARRGRTRQAARDLNTANMADSYFHAQSEKVKWLLLEFCIAQIFKSVACWPLVHFVQMVTTWSNYFEVLTSFFSFWRCWPFIYLLCRQHFFTSCSLCAGVDPLFTVLTSWLFSPCADVDPLSTLSESVDLLTLVTFCGCWPFVYIVWKCWPLDFCHFVQLLILCTHCLEVLTSWLLSLCADVDPFFILCVTVDLLTIVTLCGCWPFVYNVWKCWPLDSCQFFGCWPFVHIVWKCWPLDSCHFLRLMTLCLHCLEVLTSWLLSLCAGFDPFSILSESVELLTFVTLCSFWPLLSFCVKCRVGLLFTWFRSWKLFLLCKTVDLLFTFWLCKRLPLFILCVDCDPLFILCVDCDPLFILCVDCDPLFILCVDCAPLCILCVPVSVDLLLTFVLVLILDPLFFFSYFCMCWPFDYFVLHLFLCISVTTCPRPACVVPFFILCVK